MYAGKSIPTNKVYAGMFISEQNTNKTNTNLDLASYNELSVCSDAKNLFYASAKSARGPGRFHNS